MSRNDVEMPDDGTETGASVLDQVEERKPAGRKTSGVKVRQTKKGVEVAFQGNTVAEQPSHSPADPEVEIQSMVDVETVRPSLPKAIRGQLSVKREAVHYDVCEDDTSPAINGWCGYVPDAPGFQEEILKRWGGGKYVYTGIDKNGKAKSEYLDLGGYSRPIPGTPKSPSQPSFPEIDPSFGFGTDFRGGGTPVGHGIFREDDGTFVAPPVDEGPEEWIWSSARHSWVWKGRGRPPGPAPRGTPFSSVGSLDHGDEGQGKMSFMEMLQHQEEKRREAEERERREAAERRREEREERRAEEERRREEERDRRAEEQRRKDEEREQRRQDEERRREEENRRREEERERREAEREERRREDEKRREERAEAIRQATEAARIQAEAAKETAKQQAEAIKEAARLQAANTETIIKLVTTNRPENPIGLLKEGMQLALDAASGRESENPAVQIAEAIQTAAPALANAGKDVLLTWKGYPQAAQGAPNPLAGGAPALGAAPAPPGLPGPGAPPAGGTDPREVVQNLQLVSYLVQAIRMGIAPKSDVLAHGCMAYGMTDKFVEIAGMVQLATPEVIVARYAQGAQAVGSPFVEQIPVVQQVATSDQGRAWLAALKVNVAKRLQATQTPQGQQAAPKPPAKQVDPNAGVDPTRPVIPNAPGPPVDPNAVDPTRPDIKPS